VLADYSGLRANVGWFTFSQHSLQGVIHSQLILFCKPASPFLFALRIFRQAWLPFFSF